MEDYSDAIPVELWHMVFSLLSFEDLKSCRLVCKHWLDLVKSLREFRSKNCLRLEYCTLSENEPPLTVLHDPSLKFSGLIVGDKMRLEFSPNLSMRLAQIFETVTYLDFSQLFLRDRVLRYFFENLSFFKVLNHLRLRCMSDLLDAAFKERCFRGRLYCVLDKVLTNQLWNVITKEYLQENFENENVDEFLEKAALEGYKDVVVEEITNNLNRLKTGSFSMSELADIIANKLRDLEKKKVNTSLSRSRNESVLILSVDHLQKPYSSRSIEDLIEDLSMIHQLLPKLQEFQILEPVSYKDKSLLEFIEVYLDKTTQYSVSFDFDLNICSLPSLQGLKTLKLENNNDNDKVASLDVTNLFEKYPTLNNISLVNFSLPQDNFQYLSEFEFKLSLVSYFNLTNLSLFENLSYLHLYNYAYDRSTPCFMNNHHPIILKAMKTFKFNIGNSEYCQGCFSTLLKAFPNLSHLEFEGKGGDVDSIFQYQPDLVELKVNVLRLKIENTDWPEIKRLRKLELTCDEIVGDKDDWDRFTKKLDRLKYLMIFSGCCLEIKKILKAGNMPWLQQVEIYEKDKIHKEIIVRNGIKVLVEFHPREIEDSDYDYNDNDDSDDDDADSDDYDSYDDDDDCKL